MTCVTVSPLLVLLLVCGVGASERPNILIIVADDLGYRDVGFQGSPDIPTPNLDRLAQSGVRATQGYVSCPVCSPSRAGLLTGRNGVRFGFEFNPNKARDAGYCLPQSETTIADRLQAVGYRTGAIGKWHLGEDPASAPPKRGFAYWHGHLTGGHNYLSFDLKAPSSSYDAPLTEGAELRTVGFEGHLTAHFGRKAADFVTKAGAKPWFLYLAFNAPHSPFEPAKADLEPVRGIADPLRRSYAGLVVGLDRAVGRVLDAIEASGARERTLVFFLSDNGGAMANDHLDPRNKGLPMEQRRQFSDNAPLAGFKHSLWEGGIRVPFLVAWPGRIPAGTTDVPLWSLDIAATALAAAGAPPAADADGVDLLPFLGKTTTTPPREELFLRYGINDQPGRVLRSGPLKLLDNLGVVKLFDVVADPGEQNDLAASRPADVTRLEARWKELEKRMIAPLWSPSPGGRRTGEESPP